MAAMHCKQCDFMLAYSSRTAKLLADGCPNCGPKKGALMDDAADVFKHNKYPEMIKEFRPSQLAMAEVIEDALIHPKSTLYLEGETGVGKSLAYLVPAVLAKKRVVIATAKKPLQDQLLKELDYINKHMNLDLAYGVYKGKNNYACLKCADSIKHAGDKAKFKSWVQECYDVHQTPADLIDWKGERPKWWSDVTVENCPARGASCTHASICQPYPTDMDFVITNHTLVAIDLFKTFNSLLGDYSMLVVDEAHDVVKMFRSALSQEATINSVDALYKRFSYDDDMHMAIANYGGLTVETTERSLFHVAEKFKQLHKNLFVTVNKNTNKKYPGGQWDHLPVTNLEDHIEIVTLLLTEVGEIGKKFTTLHHRMKADLENASYVENKDKHMAILGRVNRMIKKLETFSRFLSELETDVDKTGLVVKIEVENKLVIASAKGIEIQPINIAKTCKEVVSKYVEHKIFTSATITSGGNFDHTIKNLGLDGEGEYFKQEMYRSPFSQNQSRLYIPIEMPRPIAATVDNVGYFKWIDALTERILNLIKLTNGKAFVLFTAYNDLEKTYERMDAEALEDADIEIFAQTKDAVPQQLLAQYKAHPKGVLFGTKSFWEGIDLPGKDLRNVIVTKLPFPNPKDPLIKALKDKAKMEIIEEERRKAGLGFKEDERSAARWASQAHSKVSTPQMICELKQGLGRLIRTKSDYGIITILDVRARIGGWKPRSENDDHVHTYLKHHENAQKRTHNGVYDPIINDKHLKGAALKRAKDEARLAVHFWGYAAEIKKSLNYSIVNSFTALKKFVKENAIDCN
jgi:ATP-dependent DNA helicase DinG